MEAAWKLQIVEGHWGDTYLSVCSIGNDTESGKFAEIATKEYDPVKPGQPVLRIIDDSKLFAVANVPMGTVKVGDKVRLAVGGVAAEGRVYEVAPHADSRTGTVRIRVLVENPDGKLMVGMTGTIDG